jgi:1-aminocyclopropane-1-carboxylate deaminase/D-cysteine desulfhydrase-like pyridoxal-dependent ACC family enzyme
MRAIDHLILSMSSILVQGLSGRWMVFDVNVHNNVRYLKEQIFEMEGTPCEEQMLISSGQILRDSEKLSDYSNGYGCIVHETLRLLSGVMKI